MTAPRHLYKILSGAAWAEASDHVPWAEVDRRDGFVHLSTAAHVEETARRHFHGQRDLVLLVVDGHALPPGRLRWEPSRGGDLFPHVYGDIPAEAVARVFALETRETGEVCIPTQALRDG